MILSFINIRKVHREGFKTSGLALGFQHFPRDLAHVNEWKIMFGPSNVNILANELIGLNLLITYFYFQKYGNMRMVF